MAKTLIYAVSDEILNEESASLAPHGKILSVINSETAYWDFIKKISDALQDPKNDEVSVIMVAHGVRSLSDRSELRGNILLLPPPDMINIHPSQIIQDIERGYGEELSNKLKFDLFACNSGRNIKDVAVTAPILETRSERYSTQLPTGPEITIHAGHRPIMRALSVEKANSLLSAATAEQSVLNFVTEAETSKIIFKTDDRLETYVRSAPKFKDNIEDATAPNIKKFLEIETDRYLENFLLKHGKIDRVECADLSSKCKDLLTPDVIDKYTKDAVLLELFRGEAKYVEQYLESGFDPDTLLYSGTTALHAAIIKGNLDVARTLIDHGANIDIKSSSEKNCLQLAIENKNLPIIELLLASGADIDKTSDSQKTPLFLAIEGGNLAVISKLLENGANPNIPLEGEFSPVMSALKVLGKNDTPQNRELFKTLLLYTDDSHPCMKFRDTLTRRGFGDIVATVQDPDLIAIAAFNKSHNDEMSQEYRAETSERKMTAAKKMLESLDEGSISDVSFHSNGSNMLCLAIENDYTDLTIFLLEECLIDPNTTKYNQTNLIEFAIRENKFDSTLLLLERGATITNEDAKLLLNNLALFIEFDDSDKHLSLLKEVLPHITNLDEILREDVFLSQNLQELDRERGAILTPKTKEEPVKYSPIDPIATDPLKPSPTFKPTSVRSTATPLQI